MVDGKRKRRIRTLKNDSVNFTYINQAFSACRLGVFAEDLEFLSFSKFFIQNSTRFPVEEAFSRYI